METPLWALCLASLSLTIGLDLAVDHHPYIGNPLVCIAMILMTVRTKQSEG